MKRVTGLGGIFKKMEDPKTTKDWYKNHLGLNTDDYGCTFWWKDKENKKVIAGIMAILFGSLGIHKFILGYTKEGIIQMVITFLTCGAAGIIGFIEGVIYLTKSDKDFYNTYQVGKRPWF